MYQRLQRGAVGLGWYHYARQMTEMSTVHAAVDVAVRSQAKGVLILNVQH